jgi:hypothetical protein
VCRGWGKVPRCCFCCCVCRCGGHGIQPAESLAPPVDLTPGHHRRDRVDRMSGARLMHIHVGAGDGCCLELPYEFLAEPAVGAVIDKGLLHACARYCVIENILRVSPRTR